MLRKKQHQSDLNRIIRDVRLSPNRAMLAILISMREDAETDEDRLIYTTILLSTFGDPKHIKWLDAEDPPSTETHLSRNDAAQTAKVKEFYTNLAASISNPKEKADDAS